MRSGLSPSAVRKRLECATQQPIPAAAELALRRWASEYESIHVRDVVLLETSERETLTALSRDRVTRSCFEWTVSPRAVVIEREQTPRLLKRLDRLGRVAHSDIDMDGKLDAVTGELSPDGHLLLAAETYMYLGAYVALAEPLPVGLLDELRARLSPTERALASRLAGETVEALNRPVIQQPSDEVPASGRIPIRAETWRARLERAISKNEDIVIEYQGGSREGRTRRRIEPFRIEVRRGRQYLAREGLLRRKVRSSQ